MPQFPGNVSKLFHPRLVGEVGAGEETCTPTMGEGALFLRGPGDKEPQAGMLLF